eukprot:1100914_1
MEPIMTAAMKHAKIQPWQTFLTGESELERRGPLEDEDVHGTFEGRLDESQEPHTRVVFQTIQRQANGLRHRRGLIAVVLLPFVEDDDEANNQQEGGEVKRSDRAKFVR